MSLTEADTCRKYVLPKLYAAGWNDDQITEQKTFTDGRIVVGAASRAARNKSVPKCSEHGRSAHGIQELTPELLMLVLGAIREEPEAQAVDA